MKVIDLLNKIANGRKIPKKFIYVDKENIRYIFDIEEDKDYWCEELGDWFFSNFSIQTILNDEIEIIEEDKEIEFEYIEEYFVPQEFLRDGSGRTKPDKNSKEYKINQLIINQKKLINIINELKKGK